MNEIGNRWWQRLEWTDVAVTLLFVLLVLVLLILGLAVDHPTNLD